MNQGIKEYNAKQTKEDEKICNLLMSNINKNLLGAESKIWHGHPVWFLDGNPVVGYSKQKSGIRLMFWSGLGFDEDKLNVRGKKFKDASIFYNDITEVDTIDLRRWLEKAEKIQWDYKNIVKRRGKLVKLGGDQ